MLIENCRIFFDGRLQERKILVEEGRIKKIAGTDIKFDEKFDGKGLILIPGLIDPHVHLREPGDTYKEDFASGSRAAIAGGFTTVMDMPNNSIPTITAERLKEKIRLSKKAICSVYFHFGATNDNFEEVKKANPGSLKIYMGESTGKVIVSTEEALIKHFKNFDRNKPIVLHAEDQGYMEKTGKRDEKAAIVAVRKALLLAKEFDRKIHLAHATLPDEIEIIKNWNNATVEVAPHHLFLSKDDESKLGNLAGVNPPLREDRTRSGLWKSLDSVDCIATDHAPHTLEDKENGAKGFPGLETSFGLVMDSVNRKLLSFERLVELMSTNPAKIFSLNNVGSIEVGKMADFTLINPRKEWTVRGDEHFTKCKWSPFEGKKLKGKVISVIKNGKVVYDNGEFLV